MQGGIRAIFSHGNEFKNTVLRNMHLGPRAALPRTFTRHESVSAAHMEEHGFESTTISDILKGKGKRADGSWLWCTTDDTVYDAVKSMTQHNVGALVVVKPGEQNSITGIITERGAHLYITSTSNYTVLHSSIVEEALSAWYKSRILKLSNLVVLKPLLLTLWEGTTQSILYVFNMPNTCN